MAFLFAIALICATFPLGRAAERGMLVEPGDEDLLDPLPDDEIDEILRLEDPEPVVDKFDV